MTAQPFYSKIHQNTKDVGNCLCVGLDPDIDKMPTKFPKTIQGITDFLCQVIDATVDKCVAYKPNISFFEGLGIDGLKSLETIRKKVPSHIPLILDAKRGDIGTTSAMQARYIFDYFGADAITLHPYMGYDSLAPFFEYKDKFSFVLGLTSNPGANDFEKLPLKSGLSLYEHVIQTTVEWAKKTHNIGLVVGATQDEIVSVRKQAKELLFLIPGVGKQGGSYQDAKKNGVNSDGLALINISRGLLYCSQTDQFQSEIINRIDNL